MERCQNTQRLRLDPFLHPNVGFLIPRPDDLGLYYANYFDLKTVAVALLGNDVGVDARTAGWVHYPLHAVALEGHEEIARLLLSRGANPRLRYAMEENTPQHFAFRGQNENIVRILLDRGADINEVSDDNQPALFEACDQGSEGIVKLLLDQGVDVNLQRESEGIVMQAAVHRGRYNAILLAHGLPPNALLGTPSSALQAAVSQNNRAAVELLLDHGADPNIHEGVALLTTALAKRTDIASAWLDPWRGSQYHNRRLFQQCVTGSGLGRSRGSCHAASRRRCRSVCSWRQVR